MHCINPRLLTYLLTYLHCTNPEIIPYVKLLPLPMERGYVFTCVCLSVCLSVCLFICLSVFVCLFARLLRKVMNGFWRHFWVGGAWWVGRGPWTKWTKWLDFVGNMDHNLDPGFSRDTCVSDCIRVRFIRQAAALASARVRAVRALLVISILLLFSIICPLLCFKSPVILVAAWLFDVQCVRDLQLLWMTYFTRVLSCRGVQYTEWSNKSFCHNCIKYWPIFKVLSLTHLTINLQ